MIGPVTEINAQPHPNLRMTEEERQLLAARKAREEKERNDAAIQETLAHLDALSEKFDKTIDTLDREYNEYSLD